VVGHGRKKLLWEAAAMSIDVTIPEWGLVVEARAGDEVGVNGERWG